MRFFVCAGSLVCPKFQSETYRWRLLKKTKLNHNDPLPLFSFLFFFLSCSHKVTHELSFFILRKAINYLWFYTLIWRNETLELLSSLPDGYHLPSSAVHLPSARRPPSEFGVSGKQTTKRGGSVWYSVKWSETIARANKLVESYWPPTWL